MEFKRLLNLLKLLNKKSHFLFGSRQVGKTTLIERSVDNAMVVDLLDLRRYMSLQRNLGLFAEQVSAFDGDIVVVDEIQKAPELLDEIQRLMKLKKWTFLLTGSSARKLKRSGTNLLGGRAWEAHLFPLVTPEIPEFDLITYLNRGGLPEFYKSEYFQEELENYIDLYLKHEIQEEGLVRQLQPFVSFLDIMGVSSGQELELKNIADDANLNPKTVANYIEILEDTLLGYRLPAFTLSKKRKPVTRAKFYFFDVGITRVLSKQNKIENHSEGFGKLFEQFIIGEVRSFNSYLRKRAQLSYWRSTSGFEVDLIINGEIAIEIKSTAIVKDKHLKSLKKFMEEGIVRTSIVVSQDEEKREVKGGITIYPWRIFLRNLWDGDIF